MKFHRGFVCLGLWALAAAAPCSAQQLPQAQSFDVLASVLDTSQREINPKKAVTSSTDEARRFRDKVISGWWEHMQASSSAKPGEFCAAMFLRAKPEPRPGGEMLFKDGMTVTLFGPGGDYRGALLGFSPLSKDHAFPNAQSGQKLLVTLRQGHEAPVTLNAVYLSVGAASHPLIVFVVPNIEALMSGIEDELSFELRYQGRVIVDINWHSGFRAREALKQCLAKKG